MKLVRDKIPEIMQADGKTPKTHIADKEEFQRLLVSKLVEEVHEFRLKPSAEELADILEVVHTLSNELYDGMDKVEEVRKKKAAERGGFSKKIVLE